MVHGLAIVTARGGAAAETVPDDAAVKVVPGDVPALADALRLLLDDGARRRTLADAAWRAGQSLPRWHDTARCVAGAILRVARA
jgi:glycosyltransferase involved in cell wall biosynthesis